MPYQYDPVLTPVTGRNERPAHQQPYTQHPHHAQYHPQQHVFGLNNLYPSSGAAGGPSTNSSASVSAGGSGGDVTSAIWGQFHLAGSHTDSSGSSPEVSGLLPSQRHSWDSSTLAGPSVPIPQQPTHSAQPTAWSYPMNEYRPMDMSQWRYEEKGREHYPYTPPPVRSHLSPSAQYAPRHHPYEHPEPRPLPPVRQGEPQDDVRPPHLPKSGRLGVKRRQKYTRSRTGCLGCRARRIKCDEGRPICRRCQVAKRECVFPDEVYKKGDKDHHQEEEGDQAPSHGRPPDPRHYDISQQLPDLTPNWGLEGFSHFIPPQPHVPHNPNQHSLDAFHLNTDIRRQR